MGQHETIQEILHVVHNTPDAVLSQADIRRGFKPEDAAGLRFIRAYAREKGIDPSALHRYEGEYLATYQNWREPADRENFIRRVAEYVGLDASGVDETFDVIENVTEHVADGGDFPAVHEPAPSIAEDLRELERISDVMRTNRHEYDKQNLGDLAIDIRRRIGPEAGIYAPRNVPADAQARTSRVDEIKGMMRDRASEYWRGPRAESIQSEYRALLSGNSAGETPTEESVSNGTEPA